MELSEKLSLSDICLNDQGGGVMYVSYGKTGTLRGEMKHHEPIVMVRKDDCITAEVQQRGGE